MDRDTPDSRAKVSTGTRRRLAIVTVIAIAGASLAACGGGSDSAPPGGTATIRGSVFAAPVAGAALTVRSAGGTIFAGPVATAADGTYSVVVPAGALSGDLRLEAAGGGFVDEATGAAATLGRLAAYAEA